MNQFYVTNLKWQNSVPESVTTTPAKIPRNGVNCIGTGVSAIKIHLVINLITTKLCNISVSKLFSLENHWRL